jgi:acylphosphatase
MTLHLSIKIIGKVQGVFFRASTREKARALGIKGFVRNERDESVYIEAEGEENTLKEFTAWCKQGPPRAVVEKVEVIEGTIKNFTGFEVQY